MVCSFAIHEAEIGTQLTTVTAPLLAAYHTKFGRGLGSLMLLRLINEPATLLSLNHGTMTFVLRYSGLTFTLNMRSNWSSGTSCEGAAMWTTPAQLTTTSRRFENFESAVDRISRHELSSVMSAENA